MTNLIASFIGTLLGTYLLSSLFMWLFKKLGDTPARLFAAFGVAFAVAFVLSGLGNADGGQFNPWETFPQYTIALLIWFSVQWWAMNGRASRVTDRPKPLRFD